VAQHHACGCTAPRRARGSGGVADPGRLLGRRVDVAELLGVTLYRPPEVFGPLGYAIDDEDLLQAWALRPNLATLG